MGREDTRCGDEGLYSDLWAERIHSAVMKGRIVICGQRGYTVWW